MARPARLPRQQHRQLSRHQRKLASEQQEERRLQRAMLPLLRPLLDDITVVKQEVRDNNQALQSLQTQQRRNNLQMSALGRDSGLLVEQLTRKSAEIRFCQEGNQSCLLIAPNDYVRRAASGLADSGISTDYAEESLIRYLCGVRQHSMRYVLWHLLCQRWICCYAQFLGC